MDSLVKRFIYFGIGLTLGIIFVFFVWDKKKITFDYLPSARVLKKIRLDTRLFSEDALQSMTTMNLDSTDIATILENGEVNFSKSKPRAEPCKTFVIEGSPKEKNITLIIEKCDTISTIEKIMITE